MTDEEKGELVKAYMESLFPGEDLKQVLAGPVAKAVLGSLPHYSNRKNYQFGNCTTATVGAFIAAYANDPLRRDPATGRMGEPLVVMIERSEKDTHGNHKVGLLGGYVNLDYVEIDGKKDYSHGEQVTAGAVREFGEELIGSDGNPVIALDEARLAPLHPGLDYRHLHGGPAVGFTGFGLELTVEELYTIQAHAKRMEEDPDYAAQVRKKSKGEVNKVMVKPLSEVLAMPREQFMHPHEFDAIVKLAEQFRQQQATIMRA